MVTAADSHGTAFAQASTESIWLGPQQQAALTHLCANTPIRVLIGPQSSGKTTLLRHFRHHLDEIMALDVGGPQADAAGVRACLLDATMLGNDGLAETEQRKLLAVYFRQRRSLGMRSILCVDNVAGIARKAWEEILLLCALESSGRPLLELVVVGDHADAENRPLRDLVLDGRTSAVEAVRYLGAPDDDDVCRYIAWHLNRIGSRMRFTGEACGRINELSQARFSEINRFCAAILAAPFSNGRARTIDTVDVDAAVGRLRRLESTMEARTIATPEARTSAATETRATAATEPRTIATTEAHTSASTEARATATVARTIATPEARTIAATKARATAATDTPPDRLVIERNGMIERVVPLSRRLVIGRSDHSDVKLDGPGIGRNHAMIVQGDGGRLAVVDLNSFHGVFVNGRRVTRQILKAGDVVSLCQYRISLVCEGSARSLA